MSEICVPRRDAINEQLRNESRKKIRLERDNNFRLKEHSYSLIDELLFSTSLFPLQHFSFESIHEITDYVIELWFQKQVRFFTELPEF